MTKRERYTTGRAGAMRSSLGFIFAKPLERSTAGRAEVIKWLCETQDDPWYVLNPVPLKSAALNEILGRSATSNELLRCRMTTKTAIGGDNLSPVLVERTLGVMADLEAGRLVFWRIWTGNGRVEPWTAFRLTPPPGMHRQDTTMYREDYHWFARCRRCGERRYAPVLISGRSSVACWNCAPVAIYGTLGAVPSKLSLIPDAIWRWSLKQEVARENGIHSAHMGLPQS